MIFCFNRIRSWINEVNITFPAVSKVYAEVKKGLYTAVLNADVEAVIDRPKGEAVILKLKDNGIGK